MLPANFMNRQTKIIFAFSIIVILCSIKPIDNKLCDLIKKVKSSNKHNYNLQHKNIFVESEGLILDEQNYKLLFDLDKSKVDTTYLVGQFKISNNRIGLISYTKTYECDHQINYYSLNIVENCRILKTKQILYEDNHGTTFEITSSLSKNFDSLTIYQKTSSEYAMEPDSNFDTIFSDIYKLDLKSKNIDTIYRKSTFKKVKIEP
jgi:hypothetical protein